ncbi:MAG TPA: SPOR domain-containing protein [Caldimonas sp.]
MALLSIFKRTNDSPAASDTGDAVQQARTRARRRLIGAVVLLVVGVIGFPLVFETRPRPIPVDIPIEIPKKDGAPALVMPPARAPGSVVAPASAIAEAPAPNDEAIITESHADAGREIAARPNAAQASAPERVASRPVSRSVAVPATESARKPAAASAAAATVEVPPKPAAAPAPAPDSARAKALLEGKPAADGGRFVVQVGAFAEVESARETRTKVEKLGLKTYTQVAQTPSGSRIRVRIGPFGTRAEADAALAKARAAGLSAVVLTL